MNRNETEEKAVRHYLSGVRYLAFLSSTALEDHWADWFLSWATGDEQSAVVEQDARAELSIRGKAPPVDRIPEAIAAVKALPAERRIRLFQQIAAGESIKGFSKLQRELQRELDKPYSNEAIAAASLAKARLRESHPID